MPRVFRRTPQSEEAASYGYRNLLRDVVRKGVEDTKAGVRKKLNPTNSDLLDMAMSMGGMLKVHGTGKLLAGLVKKQQWMSSPSRMWKDRSAGTISETLAPARTAFKQALRVPEKEYRRIRDIGWEVAHPDYRGQWESYRKRVDFNPFSANAETVWHEFTHGRQWNPDPVSPMPGKTKWDPLEAEYARRLQSLTEELVEVAAKLKITPKTFYLMHSPVERQARGVAEAAVRDPRRFEAFYKNALAREVEDSEMRLADFLNELEMRKITGD